MTQNSSINYYFYVHSHFPFETSKPIEMQGALWLINSIYLREVQIQTLANLPVSALFDNVEQFFCDFYS